MLKMTYGGQLEQLGSGRTTSPYVSRRSVVKVGGQRIRNVMLSDYLDSELEAGIDQGDEVRLSVGWMMFYRWLLGVKKDGETLREGFFLFLCGMLAHAVVVVLVAAVGGLILAEAVSETLALVAVILVLLYGLATGIMNIKAWLAP